MDGTGGIVGIDGILGAMVGTTGAMQAVGTIGAMEAAGIIGMAGITVVLLTGETLGVTAGTMEETGMEITMEIVFPTMDAIMEVETGDPPFQVQKVEHRDLEFKDQESQIHKHQQGLL